MPTSVYFNNYNSKAEQRLFEDVLVESIKIMGFDAYYLPNDNDTARDLLFGEDPLKKFTSAFPVEMYLSSALEYTGDKEFFSKFGLEIRNNVSVVLSKRSFSQRVPQNIFTRPREGDLIYVPFLYGTGELYEIKFVDSTKDFFTLGRKIPYFYEMQLEKFKYSNEVIGTGIPDIDSVSLEDAFQLHLTLDTGSGTYLQKELVYQGNSYANANVIGVVQNWNSNTKILSISNISGNVVVNQAIVGNTSSASYIVDSYDSLDPNLVREVYDNRIIEDEADLIIDFSEQNPFGEI